MRSSLKLALATLALLASSTGNIVYAGDIAIFENPDDFWGTFTPEPPPAETAAPPSPASPPPPVAKKPEISAANTLNVIEPNFKAPALADMQILGRWVGNIQYKVASLGERIYVIAPNGQIKPLPLKTDANNIVVPESSPVIEHMTASGQSVKQNEQAGDETNYSLGQKGLLRPTVVGTRTKLVDGKSTIVGGAIISELPVAPAKVQEKTLASVIVKTKQKRSKQK